MWKEVGDATGADMGMQMIVGQGMVDWFSIHGTEEGMEWHSTSSKRKHHMNEPQWHDYIATYAYLQSASKYRSHPYSIPSSNPKFPLHISIPIPIVHNPQTHSAPHLPPCPRSPHPTHRLTTSSTPRTPSLVPSTSNHSLCSRPQALHPRLTLFSPSSRWMSRSILWACGTLWTVL